MVIGAFGAFEAFGASVACEDNLKPWLLALLGGVEDGMSNGGGRRFVLPVGTEVLGA